MIVRALLVCLACAALVACGGGSSPTESAAPASTGTPSSSTAAPPTSGSPVTPGSNPPANPGGAPAANSTPSANAGSSQSALVGATVTLDGSASRDPDGDSLSYDWTLASKPSGSAAALTPAGGARPKFVADIAGTYTASLTVSDGTSRSTESTVSVTVLPTAGLEIEVDKSEPLSGNVGLALSGPTADAPVSWYVDERHIGVGRSITWDTTLDPDTSRVVRAQIDVSSSNKVEIRRTLSVANSRIVLSTSTRSNDGRSRMVYAHASSPDGIASVSATLNGNAFGTLTSKNGCESTCPPTGPNAYRFIVDARTVGSGTHAMTLVAVDNRGGSRQIGLSVSVANPPVISLSSPADGAFVHGTLRLTGNASTDTGNTPLTVTADLDQVRFLETNAQHFDTTFDLTGVAPGSHVLTIRAAEPNGRSTTRDRTVIVASSSSMVRTPIFVLGEGSGLLAVDGGRVLYRAPDNGVRMRDTVSGTEIALADGAEIEYINDWQIAGTHVYGSGKSDDCAAPNFICVHEWQADGSRRNLTTDNPFVLGPTQLSAISQSHPHAHGDTVIWVNDSANTYTLYDAISGTFSLVTPPAEVLTVANWKFDFAVDAGVVTFFYWGKTGPSVPGFNGNPAAEANVYRWRSDNGASVRLSTPGRVSIYTQTDGTRVAWSERAIDDDINGPARLLVQSIAGGPALELSSSMYDFMLRDGVLAWLEPTPTGFIHKASTSSTTTLSLAAGYTHASGGGWVLYDELGKLYAWNSATGHSALLVDAVPGPLLMSGKTVYFTVGAAGALYKLALN